MFHQEPSTTFYLLQFIFVCFFYPITNNRIGWTTIFWKPDLIYFYFFLIIFKFHIQFQWNLSVLKSGMHTVSIGFSGLFRTHEITEFITLSWHQVKLYGIFSTATFEIARIFWLPDKINLRNCGVFGLMHLNCN